MQIFVEENDFSGKTVIPFCTSDSTGIGRSAEELYEKTNTGSWLQGHSFYADTSLSLII